MAVDDSEVIKEAERVLDLAQYFYPIADLARRGTDFSRIVSELMDDIYFVKGEIKDRLGITIVKTSDVSYSTKIPLFRARIQFPLPPTADTEDFFQLKQKLEERRYMLGAFGIASIELYDAQRAEPIYELTLRVCLW